MNEIQRRWVEQASVRIPDLIASVHETGQTSRLLLGERTVDGVTVRLTLHASVVAGTGNVRAGLTTMERPVPIGGEHS